MDCSLPGSSVQKILQARILEWVTISFSGGLLDPGIEPAFPALADGFFTAEPLGKLNPLVQMGKLRSERALGDSASKWLSRTLIPEAGALSLKVHSPRQQSCFR